MRTYEYDGYWENDVKDISVLKDMKNLECLGLAYNNISN